MLFNPHEKYILQKKKKKSQHTLTKFSTQIDHLQIPVFTYAKEGILATVSSNKSREKHYEISTYNWFDL